MKTPSQARAAAPHPPAGGAGRAASIARRAARAPPPPRGRPVGGSTGMKSQPCIGLHWVGLLGLLGLLGSPPPCGYAREASRPAVQGLRKKGDRSSSLETRQPLVQVRSREVLAFHTAGASVWQSYDWDALTTIAVYGTPVDPHLLACAHAHGVRVLLVCPAGCFSTDTRGLSKKWGNKTFVNGWVNRSVDAVLQLGAGGIFVDIEASPLSVLQATQLTEMIRQLTDSMHMAQPGSIVAMAAFQLGLLLPGCGETGLPDYKGLAQAVDFLVVMNYDANPWQRRDPDDYANAALSVVNRSLLCFKHFGVNPENLILAFPWYGFVYSCAAPESAENVPMKSLRCNATSARTVGWACPAPNCTNTPGCSIDYEEYCMQNLIDRAIQQRWNMHTETPYAYFRNGRGELHRLDYDDRRSLSLKYQLAKTAGVAGIAMWTANGVGDANAPSAVRFWKGIVPQMKLVAKVQKTEDEEAIAIVQAGNPFRAYEYGGGNLSWVRGANYVPSSSQNDLATWLDYDEALVEQELQWAGASGFNAIRVFLHHLAHEANAPELLARVEHLLSSAAAAKIQVMFVLFDSCGRVNIANSSWILDGTYRNRTWIANPAPAVVDAGRNGSSWPQLERYVHDIVSVHRADSRVLGWDIHNEPPISQDPALLPFMQHWIDVVNGLIDHRIQFTCVGGAQSAPHTEPALSNLTVLTYHDYSSTTLSKDVAQAQVIGRKLRKPTLVTECMARVPSDGYEFGDSLRAVLRGTNGCDGGAAATGFFIWELMLGVDQFTYDWHRPYQGLLYPAVAGAAYGGNWRIPQEKALWDRFGRGGSHGSDACPPAAPKQPPAPIPVAPPGRGPAPRYCSPQINCTAHPDTDRAFFQYTPAGAHAPHYDAW